jgi:hypothetical protein
LRELLAMGEARGRAEWSQTSALMALTANCHRDPKRSTEFSPRDFDPYEKPSEPLEADFSVLKEVFVDGVVPSFMEEKT